MITTLSRRSAVVLLCIVFNVFCFSRVVGDDAGASATAFAAGSEVQQIVLTCATFFFVSALLIYVISVFGMRERTFEEALEQQRLQQGGASLLSLGGKKSSSSSKAAAAKQDKKRKEKEGKRKTSTSKPPKSSTTVAPVLHVRDIPLAEVEASVETTPAPLPAEESVVEAEVIVEEAAAVATSAPISKTAKKKKNKKNESSADESVSVEANLDVAEASVVEDIPDVDAVVETMESVVEPLVNDYVEEVVSSQAAPSEEQVDVVDIGADSRAEEAKEKRKKKKKSPSLSEEAAAVAPLTDAEMVVQLKDILEEKARVLKETKITLETPKRVWARIAAGSKPNAPKWRSWKRHWRKPFKPKPSKFSL